MQPETPGFDRWSTRREALLMGLALWAAGSALAGAAAWQMHRASSAVDRAHQTETVAPTPGDARHAV
jgi:hypothetical protein